MLPVHKVDAMFLFPLQAVAEQASNNPVGSQRFSRADHVFKYHYLEQMDA